jgi:hypothetical protein
MPVWDLGFKAWKGKHNFRVDGAFAPRGTFCRGFNGLEVTGACHWDEI